MGDTKPFCDLCEMLPNGRHGFGCPADDGAYKAAPQKRAYCAPPRRVREDPASGSEPCGLPPTYDEVFEAGRQLGMEQARREPLTDLQIEAGYAGLFARSKWQEEISFRLGCRFAERYHLITQPAGDSDTQS